MPRKSTYFWFIIFCTWKLMKPKVQCLCSLVWDCSDLYRSECHECSAQGLTLTASRVAVPSAVIVADCGARDARCNRRFSPLILTRWPVLSRRADSFPIHHVIFCYFVFYFVCACVSLTNVDVWPGTHYIDQAVLQLTNIFLPRSSRWSLAWAVMPRLSFVISSLRKTFNIE